MGAGAAPWAGSGNGCRRHLASPDQERERVFFRGEGVFEGVDQLSGARVALRRIGPHRLLHHGLNMRAGARCRLGRRGRRQRRTGRLAREHLVDDGAQRVDVRAGVGALSRLALGSLVGVGERGAAMPPETRTRHCEVHDLQLPRAQHHHARRLHGPVHDSAGVGKVEGHRQLAAKAQRRRRLQGLAVADQRAERAPLEELHDDMVVAHVVERHDVRVLKRAGHLGLGAQAGPVRLAVVGSDAGGSRRTFSATVLPITGSSAL